MKKLFLIAIVSIFALPNLNAQTEKGSWMFGAGTSVSFASSTAKSEYDGNESGDKTTVSTFTFNPNAGYFVMDNLTVGIDLAISTSKTKYEEQGLIYEFDTTSLGAIPNATYFFKSEKVAPYLGAGAGFLLISSGSGDSDKFSGLAIMAKGGVALFLSDSVSIDFGVNFLTSKLSNKEESKFKEKTNALGVGVGFAFFL